jgi:YYY domain-containing protein
LTSILFFILWYVVITLLGWLAFPIAYRLLPALPDRGYTISRPLALLIWGFVFWLLASLGILQNSTGGVVMALLVLAAITIWAGWQGRIREAWNWIKEHKKLIFTAEALFFIAFAVWAFIRSANPDIANTEKPMELAFINSILRSPSFPPIDPWLSGYAISYYYFGYVIISMLIRITGVGSGYGYNLTAALWFGLTALGAYGVVFNLFQVWHKKARGGQHRGLYSLPILGPVFVLVVSNLEGILDVMHSMGLFWSQTANGVWQSSFWQWLNIPELVNQPPLPLSLMPTRPGGVVWWRASRVVQDFALNGSPREIIDEFPFFSYLLSDLHPHVLAMPFVLLAITLALQVFMGGGGGSFSILGFRIPLGKPFFVLAAVSLGGISRSTWYCSAGHMSFLNIFSTAGTLVGLVNS